MNVAVIGSGALGVVLADAAERAGHRTFVCSRTPVPRLVLEADGIRRDVPVPVVTDPDSLLPVDWVLLTTKAPDTESARPWLDALCGRKTTVLVAQNGVDHRERVAPLARPAAVLPALVYVSAERTGPGHVVHRWGSRILVPEGDPGAGFAALLAGSGVEVSVTPDFTTAAWRKLLSNVAANPITAITLGRMEVLRRPEIAELVTVLLEEARAVGVAAGADLGEQDIKATLDIYAGFGAQNGTSMLYDRLAGRPTEHDLINGTIVRLGRHHGIPTPANQAVHALLSAITGPVARS
jgi:2-dehydropantoate 2-reductase